jgi:signal transduction histidine kinase
VAKSYRREKFFKMAENTLDELKSEIERLRHELSDFKRKEEENIYKIFFDKSPDIIIMVDPKYKYQYIHIPHVPRERLDMLIGQDLIMTTPEKFRPKMLESLKKVFEEKQTITYESDGESMGKYTVYLNYLSPVLDKEHNVKSAYFVSRDITLQKKTENAVDHLEEKLKIMFESINHIYNIFDLNKNLIWYNEESRLSAKRFHKVELSHGMHASKIFSSERYLLFQKQFDRALNGEILKFTTNFSGNNRKESFNVIFQPIYNKGQMIAIANIVVDISELAEKEEHSKKINKALILQNQQLYHYSHIISHNLRSPIATLIGIVNVIEEFKEDHNLANQLLGKIKGTALKLDTIIQDLNLILNQTTQEPNSKQIIDLSELMKNIIELMGGSIKNEVEINYDFSEVPEIFSIRGYIHSILYNLLSNSIKYRKLIGSANINIKTSMLNKDTICLEVSDNGMGIDLAVYGEKLFGFYKRFHTHVEGKGIGLNITKTQVEVMGGKITVESQVNVGSTFRVFLPISE